MIDIDMDEWGEGDGPDEIVDLASAFAHAAGDETTCPAGGEGTLAFDFPEAPDAMETSSKPLEGEVSNSGMVAGLKAMAVHPDDPSELGYPPTLPVEVALQTAPEEAIREAYEFTPEQWQALWTSERFRADVASAHRMLSEEGMSFRAKARLQAEELLKTSWAMIHDRSGDVPPSVKADLLKFTVRAAGLEASPKDAAAQITPLQINISL